MSLAFWIKSHLALGLCALTMGSSFALAQLAPREASSLKLDRPTLIVVHASENFDETALEQSKAGIDAQVRKFKEKSLPVVYLMHDFSEEGQKLWYTTDRDPTAAVLSLGGEHNLPLKTNDVTIVGGFFGSYDGSRGCHAMAVRNAINSHFDFQKRRDLLTIRLPIAATYFYDGEKKTRNSFLARTKGPSESLRDFERLFFAQEEGDDDPIEFAIPFLVDQSKKVTIEVGSFGYAPLDEASLQAVEKLQEEDLIAARADTKAVRRADGKLATLDGHYVEGEDVDTRRYAFELVTKGAKPKIIGTGPRRVRLVFER